MPNSMTAMANLQICLVFLGIIVQLAASASVSENEKDPSYWRKRKESFYAQTRFDLPDENLKLLGAKRLLGENKAAQPKGHLPFWFDYELYKKVFNKRWDNAEEEKARHNTYINTCIRVWKARVLYRMLAGTSDTFITADADKFHEEVFGPLKGDSSAANNEIAFSVSGHIESPLGEGEAPLDRAIKLVRQEMDIVESRNQVETNLKSFNEVDGSAIKGKLPY